MHLYWVKYDTSKLRNFYTVGKVRKLLPWQERIRLYSLLTMGILRLSIIYANFFQRRAIGQNVPFLVNRAF